MNPSVDIFVETERLVDDGKTRCRTTDVEPGGGGINVARNLHRFGGDVRAVFTAGGANGEQLKNLVRRDGFPVFPIELEEETRESLAVTETATGKLYHLVLPGPRLTEREWRRCFDIINGLDPVPGHLVLSGSLPEGAPADFYGRTARAATARGTRVILDTSGKALAPAMSKGIFLAKLNFGEFEDLGYTGDRRLSTMLSAMENFVRDGFADNLIVTLDAEGALLVNAEGDRIHARPPPTEVISHVGAGDSFVSVLVYQLQRGLPVVDAFRYGVAAAAAKVNTPGNQLENLEKVEQIYPQIAIN